MSILQLKRLQDFLEKGESARTFQNTLPSLTRLVSDINKFLILARSLIMNFISNISMDHPFLFYIMHPCIKTCLLYTSDAADEEDSVDLGGRRIIKKKKKK